MRTTVRDMMNSADSVMQCRQSEVEAALAENRVQRGALETQLESLKNDEEMLQERLEEIARVRELLDEVSSSDEAP